MRIVQIGGNVGDDAAWFSTENAFRSAFTDMGHTVIPINQAQLYELDSSAASAQIVAECGGDYPDLVLYTRTHNNTALRPRHTDTWRNLESLGAVTASVHLDVFWGLPERIGWVQNGDPLFTTGTVFTADGGSERHWKECLVNHVWLPPGADLRRLPAEVHPIPELRDSIVFVGSEGYHKRWSHRPEMIQYLRKRYGGRFVQYGGGSPRGSVRGDDLANIYASDAIIVGDFCFAGERANYWSDRVPETLGRGGFLLVTETPGIETMYEAGKHLDYWTVRDFASLNAKIDHYLDMPEERARIAAAGRDLVVARDTYPSRAQTLLETVGLA